MLNCTDTGFATNEVAMSDDQNSFQDDRANKEDKGDRKAEKAVDPQGAKDAADTTGGKDRDKSHISVRSLRPNTTSWSIPSTFVPVYELHFASEDKDSQGGAGDALSYSTDRADSNTSMFAPPVRAIPTSSLEEEGESKKPGAGGRSGSGRGRSQSKSALSVFQDPRQVRHGDTKSSTLNPAAKEDTIALARATHSNVGVIDKAAIVLASLEAGPATLVELTSRSGLSRPTAHRIATALEAHHFVSRDDSGRFILGSRFSDLAIAAGNDQLLSAGLPILQSLHDRTGESAQIYRRQGSQRTCIASVERTTGLRDSVPVGTSLSLTAGAASHVLLAWENSDDIHDILAKAHFSTKTLGDVRRRDWAESVNEREIGVSSVAAPIRNAAGQVIAAINLSGPSERMGGHPGHLYAPVVLSAAKHLSDAISHHNFR